MLSKDNIEKLNLNASHCADEIWMVFQRSYQIEADLVGVEDFPPLKRTSEQISSSDRLFFGIQSNDRLKAVIEIEHLNGVLDICSLVVDPDFFKQGLGGRLIDHVFDLYKPTSSIVETAAVNEPAIRLYQKKGFELTEQWMTSFGIEKVKLRREF